MAGDIIGSSYEFNPIKTKNFELFNSKCKYTDDTIMTCAVAYAIRNAISLGGDADTQAAITGSIAEARWGVPEHIQQQALSRLDSRLLKVVNDFKTYIS